MDKKLERLYYDRSGRSGAYSGFEGFFNAVKARHPSISRSRAASWYQEQELTQLLTRHPKSHAHRSFNFHGLNVGLHNWDK